MCQKVAENTKFL